MRKVLPEKLEAGRMITHGMVEAATNSMVESLHKRRPISPDRWDKYYGIAGRALIAALEQAIKNSEAAG